VIRPKIIQLQALCCASPYSRIEVQVVSRVEVISRQRTVELDGVVFCEVVEVEGLRVPGGGEVEVNRLLEGRVKAVGVVVVGCFYGCTNGLDVDVLARAGEEAVVGEVVEPGAWGSN